MPKEPIIYTESELNRPTKVVWIVADVTSRVIAQKRFVRDLMQLIEIDTNKKVIIISDDPIPDVKDTHHSAVSALYKGTIRRVVYETEKMKSPKKEVKRIRDNSEETSIKSACTRLKNGVIFITKELSDESLNYIYGCRNQGNDVVVLKNSLLPTSWEETNVIKNDIDLRLMIYARPSYEFTNESIEKLGMFYKDKTIPIICSQFFVTHKYAKEIADYASRNPNFANTIIGNLDDSEFTDNAFITFVFNYQTGKIYSYDLKDVSEFDNAVSWVFTGADGYTIDMFKKQFLITV